MEPQEHFVDYGNVRIWSCVSGQGRDVLLWNGGPGCDDYLAPLAAMLERRCRVVRFESRGCGRSSRDGNYDLATTVADAESVRRYYGMSRVIHVGHSQGPNHALVHALLYPDVVQGIIGIAGGKVVDDRHWSEVFHRNHADQGEDLGGLEFDADPEVNLIGNRTYRDFCRTEAFLRRLAELQQPVAFINGGADIRPNWPTRQLSALLPRSRYVEIAEAPHMLWFTHAAQLEHELHDALDWLQAQGGRGG